MYERELKMLGATGAIVEANAVLSSIENDGRLSFELQLKITGSDEIKTLVTSHGKVRLFPNLNFLYLLVRDSCPTIKAVSVLITKA